MLFFELAYGVTHGGIIGAFNNTVAGAGKAAAANGGKDTTNYNHLPENCYVKCFFLVFLIVSYFL